MAGKTAEKGAEVLPLASALHQETQELDMKFALFENKVTMSLDEILRRQTEEAGRSEERHTTIVADVSEINKAIYDPELGIFSRLKTVEESRKTTSKLVWIITTSLIGISLCGAATLIWALLKVLAST